jgi:hypothetical protein
MKAILYLSMLTVIGFFWSGCAGAGSGLALDTVGPGPNPIVSTNAGSGTLTVFSAYKVNADFNSTDPNRLEYSDYRILNADRKAIKWVHNVANNYLQEPVRVELAAGKYFVAARSNGYGILVIPVIIAANQNTVIRLNGVDSWPDASVFNSSNAVRLPDGEIVGWKYASGF